MSIVGGLWKQLVSAGANAVGKGGNDFPYQTGSFHFQLGPFKVFHGTSTNLPADSQYAQVSVWRAPAGDPVAKRTCKQMRTLKHPGMCQALTVKEDSTEICIATERLLPAPEWPHLREAEWRGWAGWQVGKVKSWLTTAAGMENDCELTVLIASSGECRIVLIENEFEGKEFEGEAHPNQTKTPSRLVKLHEDLEFLPLMTPSQLSSFLLASNNSTVPDYIHLHLLLPRFARRCVQSPGTNEISLEEVKVLFGPKSASLLSGSDFGALLSGLCLELLNRMREDSPQLLQLIQCLPAFHLPADKWFNTKLLPQLTRLFTSPTASPGLRFSVLKALKTNDSQAASADVLRLLARGQADSSPAIRVEAFKQLQRALPRLANDIQAKIAGPAVCRALGDAQCAELRLLALQGLKEEAAWLERWIGEAQEFVERLGPVLLRACLRGGEEAGVAFEVLEGRFIPRLKRISDGEGVGVGAGKEISKKTTSNTLSSSNTVSSSNTLSSTSPSSTPSSTTSFTPSNSESSTPTPAHTTPSTNTHTTPSNNTSSTTSNQSSKLKLGSIKKIT